MCGTLTDPRTDKEVHKTPELDVVGWFTLCPETGPLPEHAPIHKQLATLGCEHPILLAIHPAAFKRLDGTKGKLPITIYETVTESHPQSTDSNAMQVDSDLHFRTVPYSVETDETEMIAINYVAKGAGSASAVSQSSRQDNTSKKSSTDRNGSDLQEDHAQASATENHTAEASSQLTSDEEDQIAALTTRLNSVRMLQSRLTLLTKFCETLPPCYLTDESIPFTPTTLTPDQYQSVREIQALITRLSLLTPSDTTTTTLYHNASQSQANDVAISSLLADLGVDIQNISELGRKFAAAEHIKSSKQSRGAQGRGPPGGPGMFEDQFGARGNPMSLTSGGMLM